MKLSHFGSFLLVVIAGAVYLAGDLFRRIVPLRRPRVRRLTPPPRIPPARTSRIR